MLCSTKQLDGLVVAAQDGELGSASHALFDDARWAIRHLVVRTGTWLKGRDVLVSPHAVERVEPDNGQVGRLVVRLTRRQVEEAPHIDTAKPVSRQMEEQYNTYYGYPSYWAGAGLWGAAAYPMAAMPPLAAEGSGMPIENPRRDAPAGREKGDPHLRSTAEVEGYHIEAADGGIGHVEEFIFDPASWAIRYIVVDTRDWLPGRKVLVDPEDIDSIDWGQRQVRVRLTRDAIKARPDFRREELLASAALST